MMVKLGHQSLQRTVPQQSFVVKGKKKNMSERIQKLGEGQVMGGNEGIQGKKVRVTRKDFV